MGGSYERKGCGVVAVKPAELQRHIASLHSEINEAWWCGVLAETLDIPIQRRLLDTYAAHR